MPHTVREVRRTYVDDDPNKDGLDTRNAIVVHLSDVTNVAARTVYFIGGLIIGVLSLRFILMLLGANVGNAFVGLVYDLSQPLAVPFFGMFNYDANVGQSRFEFETLVAIAVYGLLTWALVSLLGLADRRTSV